MKKLLSVLLITFMGLTGVAFGQSAKDTYKALKKVEARVQAGVSYRDYPKVIGDAKVEVNLFLESKEAKENPQLALHIKKAMDYYMKAGDIWSIQFTQERPDGIIYADSPDSKRIRGIYPQAKLFKGSWFIPALLNDIWTDASKEINNAKKYLE